MKTKSIIFSFVIAAFLSSSIPSGSHSLEIGAEAPQITLSTSSADSVGQTNGKEIIVNFWSASDAMSRLANRRISMAASSDKSSDKEYISICIDSDKTLAKEIARIDGISDDVKSLFSDDVTSDVLSDYQTDKGCRTFVIDRYGNLKAIAETSDVASILS